ncbi:hypothetical protein HQN88_21765 [Paenibacillus qinlingensis]|nr:hypothetical protein [Paenibacillus qinlingensis]
MSTSQHASFNAYSSRLIISLGPSVDGTKRATWLPHNDVAFCSSCNFTSDFMPLGPPLCVSFHLIHLLRYDREKTPP